MFIKMPVYQNASLNEKNPTTRHVVSNKLLFLHRLTIINNYAHVLPASYPADFRFRDTFIRKQRKRIAYRYPSGASL